jgi:hypothetical protein
MNHNKRRRHRSSLAALGIALSSISIAGSSAGVGAAIVPFQKVDDGAQTVDDLRSRDLSLPKLGSEDICPVVAFPEPVFEGAGAGVRAGPVGAVGIGVNGVLRFDGPTAGGWSSSKILWIMDADLPPLLVRGRRLDGPGEVHFRTSGADSASSLVLDQDVQSTIGPELRDQPSGPRVRESGCYALQIDGPDFQSVIVFRAIVGDAESPSTRTFELRDFALDEGEAVAFGFHTTRDPISIEVSVDGLEMCPAELALVFEGTPQLGPYWFDECLPLAADAAVELPAPLLVDHIAVLVRSRTDANVKEAGVSITYQPGDEFFHLATPPLDPGERTAALVVTPKSWDVVVADPSAGDSTSGMRVLINQHGKRVRATELPERTREGSAHGPVQLGEPVIVRMQNKTGVRQAVSLAVYWS